MTNPAATATELVVIGGGPSAVAALHALLEEGTPKSITVVDPNEIGIGFVFGPRCAGDPALLCNSSAGVTYLDEHYPDEFADFCASRGWPVGKDDYAPRFIFGQFCRDKYLRVEQVAKGRGVPIVQVRARASKIECLDSGRYRVHLDDGSSLVGSDVLLAPGIEEPSLPAIVAEYKDNPRLFRGTYPVDRLRDLPGRSHVLIIGLRSSALDASQVLSSAGHTSVMTSPSGRLSAVRDRLRIAPKFHFDRDRWLALDASSADFEGQIFELLTESIQAAAEGVPMSEQVVVSTDVLSRLRAELEVAETGKSKWSDLGYHGIGIINDMVGPWDAATRARLLPKAYGLLTRYVNALPVLIAKRLLATLEAGISKVSPVFLESVQPRGEKWEAVWADGRRESFDAVVAASGYGFPRFPIVDATSFALSNGSRVGPQHKLAVITESLRLDLGRASGPERIWAIGPASNQRFPMAHIIYLAARHSRWIAPQILHAKPLPDVSRVPIGPAAEFAA